MAEIRYVVMRCHSCRWTWDAIVVGSDLEPCPECDSSDVSIDRCRAADVPLGVQSLPPPRRGERYSEGHAQSFAEDGYEMAPALTEVGEVQRLFVWTGKRHAPGVRVCPRLAVACAELTPANRCADCLELSAGAALPAAARERLTGGHIATPDAGVDSVDEAEPKNDYWYRRYHATLQELRALQTAHGVQYGSPAADPQRKGGDDA